MNRIAFVILSLLLFGCASTYAQKPKPKDFGIKSRKALDAFLEGQQQIQYRTYDVAIRMFDEAVSLEPNFAEARYLLGTTLVNRRRYGEALPHLEKAVELKPDDFPGADYYLGKGYFFEEKYAEAVPRFRAYLSYPELNPDHISVRETEFLLQKAIYAQEAIQRPVPFAPQNLGSKINSAQDDNLPYLTADEQTILFTSRRAANIGGFNRNLGEYDEDFYIAFRDEAGNWGEARNLGDPINTELNEGAPCLSQDGRLLIFTGCNRREGFGSCDLYLAYRNGDTWSEPENLGPNVNTPAWETQPCLSQDGRYLFFTSNRRGGLGGSDIWVCERTDDGWSEARNLGEPVNSPGNEAASFLHADGQSLYFASDFHNGFGSMDLFVSYRYNGDRWTEPQNLGYPINTASEEGYIFVNPGGDAAYINSTREGGFGKNDLYVFELPEAIRPRRATFLRGLVVDSLTRTPVYARIRLVDVETGDTVRTMYSDRANGRFLMSLPFDRQYAATVYAPKYLFASKQFVLKSIPDSTYFDLTIELQPLREGKTIRLDNIFFASGESELEPTSLPELRFLHFYLQQNPRLRIAILGHTDNVGTEADNQALSQARAEAVRTWLIEQGISKARIEANGFGESMPVAPNETEEGRALNRRTEFKILSN